MTFFSWLGILQVVFNRKTTKMHGHKKKKSEWDKKRIKNGMRNNWDMDDDSDMPRTNQKKKRRFRFEEKDYLEEEDGFEEDFQEDDNE